MLDDEPLWTANNQDERLHELLGIPSELKERPLRRDVSSLGRLLGKVIREQEGLPLYEMVEALRTLSIAGRAGDSAPHSRSEIAQALNCQNIGERIKIIAQR